MTDLRDLLPLAAKPRLDALRRAHPGDDDDALLARLSTEGTLSPGDLAEVAATLPVDAPPGIAVGVQHRYLGVLGGGAMGEVLVARDSSLRRTVAVKRMNAEVAKRPTSLRRFATEARVTAQLEHPSIIPVYALVAGPEGQPEYAMKLVRGRTLDALIGEVRAVYEHGGVPTGDLSLAARLEVFVQVCHAMDYAHARGVLHRDLKPENIMIGHFHEVLVVDWGLARVMAGADLDPEPALDDGSVHKTQLGIAVGTPMYMSPEQAQGLNEELDGRSDLFALGLVLYELVTLKPAIDAKTGAEAIVRAASADLGPFVHAFGAPIPTEIEAIVSKCTQLDREARYPKVAALADDLHRYLRDEAITALPDTSLRRAQRWVAHHRERVVGAIALLVVLGVVSVSTIGAFAAVAVLQAREEAHHREERLAALTARVTEQAHQIDTTFLRYESQVVALARTAERALAVAPPATTWWPSDTFVDGAPVHPPGWGKGAAYPMPISIETPDVWVTRGVNPADVDAEIRQLVTLTPELQMALVRAADPDVGHLDPAALWKRIAVDGLPLVWAYVGTESGVAVAIPGAGGYPADYDPRTRAWYKSGQRRRAPHWTPASIDEGGLGLLVSCAVGIWDAEDKYRGVLAMDVSIQSIIDDLLNMEDVAGVDAFLVDEQGRTVAQTTPRQSGVEELPPFADTALIAAAQQASSGRLDRDGQLTLWGHAPAIGWTYVVVGPTDALVGR